MQGFGMTECNSWPYTRPGGSLVPGLRPATRWPSGSTVAIADNEKRENGTRGTPARIVVGAKARAAHGRLLPDDREDSRGHGQPLWFTTGDDAASTTPAAALRGPHQRDCIRRRGENISSVRDERCSKPIRRWQNRRGRHERGRRRRRGRGEGVVVPTPGEVDPVELLDGARPGLAATSRCPASGGRAVSWQGPPPAKLQQAACRAAGVTAATWDREFNRYVVRR